MKYKTWIKNHSIKHKNILNKLKSLSDDEIVEYFDFDNMVKNEPDFCPLYKDNKKCHDMEKLNCYFCACPLFRIDDTKSYCDINSKYGSTIQAKDGFIHQDCSNCQIPHKTQYIKNMIS
jgi:Zn-finger protein